MQEVGLVSDVMSRVTTKVLAILEPGVDGDHSEADAGKTLQIEERGLKVMIGRCIHLHIRREHSEGPISVIDWVP